MKILMTGFEPFGGRDLNPSQRIVEALTAPADTLLIRKILPVSFTRSRKELEALVSAEHPDILLSLGQAGNAPRLAVERVGINCMSSLRIDGSPGLPDCDGFAPEDEKIEPAGPDACFSTLPLRRLAAAVNEAGIPAGVSNTAGTYVCNTVLYAGCRLAQASAGRMLSGFVHVPFLPEQLAADPSPDGKIRHGFRNPAPRHSAPPEHPMCQWGRF